MLSAGSLPCPISDTALCAAAAAAYTQAATIVVGDVHAVITTTDGITTVAFRGTVPTSWLDWFRDFAAWPDRIADHPSVGCCHAGFITGAEAILPTLNAALTGPYVLTGHSLGGALAIAAGALLTDCGKPPLRLTTFGAPRVGFGLTKVLAPIDGVRYRHGLDPIPEVPSWPYLNDRPWTHIGQANHLDPIGDHAISRYALALASGLV
jgi:predicted lipase